MQNSDPPKWKTTESKYLVNDRWIKLRADTCVTPDGNTITPWYVLEYSDWVNCLVIDRDDNVILLRHYRQGAGEYVQEIIAGMLDPHETDPVATIARELKEEIGYEGGQIYKTGVTYANAATHNNKAHSFLAVGGTCTADTLKEHGADFVVEKMPFQDFVALITDPASQHHEVPYQALQIAAIFFAFNFIRQSGQSSKGAKSGKNNGSEPNSESGVGSEALARLRQLLA